MECSECGHKRFWIYQDRAECQRCGAVQYKLALTDTDNKSCRVCTKPITGKRSDAQFCSAACRQLWHRAQRGGHTQHCYHCGEVFRSTRPAKFCSARCRKAASRARKQHIDVSDVPTIYIDHSED